jgi:hypothetical protein
MYTRVIPRDLFNEANLLKCLGRISLLITNEFAPAGLQLTNLRPTEGFPIDMHAQDGSIYCPHMRLSNKHGLSSLILRPCNSRDPYPVFLEWLDEEVQVFDDDGAFTDELLEWANTATKE